MKKAMTITYEYEGALYVNLTNRCDCACVFCLRHNGHKAPSTPTTCGWSDGATRQEALDNLLARDFSQYRELVFCGFGEPMYRTDDIVWLVDELKKRVPNLPPVRINTNGHANLFLGRDVAPCSRGALTPSPSPSTAPRGGVLRRPPSPPACERGTPCWTLPGSAGSTCPTWS